MSIEIRFVTLFTDGYLPASICVPTLNEYCSRWGWRLTCFRRLLVTEAPASWNKVAAVWQVLRKARTDSWVVWVDADIIIVNYNIDLREYLEHGKDIVLCKDFGGICAGLFGIRNNRAGRRFMNLVGRGRADEWPWEQKVMKNVMERNREFASVAGEIDDDVIQNKRSVFCEGAFAVHLWGNGAGVGATTKRAEYIRKYGWNRETFLRVWSIS